MNISTFTFILTEDCNLNCSYCYQKRGKHYLDAETVEKACEFFFPHLARDCFINFYGGEPFLAFEQIKQAVETFEKLNKKRNKYFHYAVTTNGTLLKDDILQFLDDREFQLELSFDGLGQDLSRGKGSFRDTISLIKRMRKYPQIKLMTNSVFLPKTLRYFSDSIELLMDLEIPDIEFTLCQTVPWNSHAFAQLKRELARTRQTVLVFSKKKGVVPVVNFRRVFQKTIFGCSAGLDSMALSADGRLWGCFLFADYFQGKEKQEDFNSFCFGKLDSFIKNHERTYAETLTNYANLRMDYFYTPKDFCLLCESVKDCRVCPAGAAFVSLTIGMVSQTTCTVNRIMNNERQLFWKELSQK